jgi:hypothetical protein
MKEQYFNFPIQLLGGFMKNDNQTTLKNILDYVIYEDSLKLYEGSKLEKIITCATEYNITLGNNENSLTNGKKLYELYNIFDTNSPRAGIKLSIWWDFYKNDKTEFDKICLLSFLAIKSILGRQKSYCKTTNLYLWARMDGKVKAVNDVFDLSQEVRKYANEYQTKKIKQSLINNWGLVTYSRYCRGFYVSYKLTLEGLITEAEKRRESTKERQYKDHEKELIKKVLDKLKETRP